MADMLVKLYSLPSVSETLREHRAKGIDIRRALAPEKHLVVEWVRQSFGDRWASECEVSFSNHPVSCYVAVENQRLAGFACYDAACKNFFGPMGVNESVRGKGIGKVLLLQCLHAMAAQGYAYAIIGGTGPVDFYAQTVGAVEIPDSTPGIYRGLLSE